MGLQLVHTGYRKPNISQRMPQLSYLPTPRDSLQKNRAGDCVEPMRIGFESMMNRGEKSTCGLEIGSFVPGNEIINPKEEGGCSQKYTL